MVVQPSPGASAVPLVIEPVIGWRLWRLERDGDGGVRLVSPLRPYRWRPMEPNHAGCHRHVGQQVPSMGCGCGVYAVTHLHRLPGAFGWGATSEVGVVGSVALWGRVVEHAAGYRGQLAYPDRLRLICRACFLSGVDGVPEYVEFGSSGTLLPVCEEHASFATDVSGIDPGELEQELLSAYAVDLLPVQTLHEAGFFDEPPSPGTFAASVKAEARDLSRGGNAFLTVALLIGAFLGLRAMGVFEGPADRPEPTSVAEAVVEGPFPDDVEAVARPQVGTQEPDRPFRFTAGIVCGQHIGSEVRLRACGRPRAELIGFYDVPATPRSRCTLTGYSRKPRFSVCWLDPAEDLDPPLDMLRLPGIQRWDLG